MTARVRRVRSAPRRDEIVETARLRRGCQEAFCGFQIKWQLHVYAYELLHWRSERQG